MEYFKINNTDFSHIVKTLKVNKTVNYNSQTNAAGNTVVDYINKKRTIEVGIIPLNDADMLKLQLALDTFNINVSFRNPTTNTIETANCICPNTETDYYTIQENKIMYQEGALTFIEL